jgi:hypothetical protein
MLLPEHIDLSLGTPKNYNPILLGTHLALKLKKIIITKEVTQ